jgi:glycosyltransferase involved in cell wall biosynthesis
MTQKELSPALPRVLFVGAFPSANRTIFGGMVTDCRALLDSSLPRRAALDLVDTTQAAQPLPGLMRRLIFSVRRLISYVWRVERGHPDAVLLFTAAGASVAEKGAMAWYARLRGIPALMFPRAGPVLDACRESRFTRWWVRGAFAGANTVLCMGETWQKFAQETLGFDAAHTPIISSWTATRDLLALGAAREPANGPVRLLFVGWLDREKGVGELLEACRMLARARRFELTLVGEGNLSRHAKDFVADHALEGFIRLAGWRSGADLHDAYARADVFVLPSWSEGLPNAMVEAMAAGLACVVSTVGSVPDVVKNDESALLVSPRDAVGLERALARVIDDADLRRRLGKAAHAIAARDFGVEQAVDHLLQAVHSARASRKRRSPENGMAR